MLIDINKNTNDPFYRYKMPKLAVKIEGRGNGIKTVLLNLKDISDSLKRKPIYLLKFIARDLGSNSTCDEANNKYVVNGAHDKDKVQDIIHEFIGHYVMCSSCENPETFFINEKNVLKKECFACGAKSKIEEVGKMNALIIKDYFKDGNSSMYSSVDLNTNAESNEDIDKIILKQEDVSEELYLLIKNNKIKEEDLFNKIFEVSKEKIELIGNLKKILSEDKNSHVLMLGCLEVFVVRNKIEKKIGEYLNFLFNEKIVKRNEVFKYFQCKSKKLDKKEADVVRKYVMELYN